MILATSFYDMNQKMLKKGLFPKFQVIPILRLQVMYDYAFFTASYISTVLNLLSSTTIFGKNHYSYFTLK